jgi:hypothetical protein
MLVTFDCVLGCHDEQRTGDSWWRQRRFPKSPLHAQRQFGDPGNVAMAKKPSLPALVKTDFLSLFLSLVVPVSLGLAIWAALRLPIFTTDRVLDGEPFEHLTQDHARFFAAGAGLGAPLVPCLLWLRLRAVRRAFAGTRVQGRITKITMFKDRAYLHFRYEHEGRNFETWRFVHQSASLLALREGQTVEIAFDPWHPRSGWVVALFE